jgi:hypothetical protein
MNLDRGRNNHMSLARRRAHLRHRRAQINQDGIREHEAQDIPAIITIGQGQVKIDHQGAEVRRYRAIAN